MQKWLTAAIKPIREEYNNFNSPVKFYDFWDISEIKKVWFYRFIEHRKIRDKAKLKNIRFYSVFRQHPRHRYLKNDESSVSIFYTGENIDNFPAFHDHLIPKVDISLGFEYLDFANYLRFPLWILYVVEPEWGQSEVSHYLNIKYNDQKFLPRNAFCSMVASHDRSGVRLNIMNLIAKYGSISSGGRKYNNTQDLNLKFNNDKLKFLKEFYLNICPENTNKAGYVTEKLFQAIESGCIPIYWGSDNRPEPEILNESAYWTVDFKHPEILESKLSEFSRNPVDIYKAWLAQPKLKSNFAEIILDYMDKLELAIINCNR